MSSEFPQKKPRPRPSLGALKSPPRKQADRIALTRQKIIDSTVRLVEQQGYHQATMQRIAQEAGLTVGSLQYHFSNKQDLIGAVLEENFLGMSNEIKHLSLQNLSLEERISRFVDTSWNHVRSPEYQASLQILLEIRNSIGTEYEQWMAETYNTVMKEGIETWVAIFSDTDISRKQHINLMQFCFSSLTGTAIFSRINGQGVINSDLAELKQALFSRFQ